MAQTSYEEKYHESQHGYLLKSFEYYQVRSRLAKDRYFSDYNTSDKVLDFGIGLGQNVLLLEDREGLETSKFAVNYCKEKGIKTYSSVKQVPNNKYDIVLCCHVLEHADNPLEVLKIIRNKLKKNGKLILVLPKEEHGKVEFEIDVNQHLYAWNFRTVNNLLHVAGFKVKENKDYYGTGFYKLKFVARINFWLYKALTSILGRLLGKAEMYIESVKV